MCLSKNLITKTLTILGLGLIVLLGTSQAFASKTISLISFDWGEFYVDEFEKETGIKVDVTIAPFEERFTKLVASFAAGKPYDIVMADNSQVQQFIRSGWIIPVDEIVPPEQRSQYFDFVWRNVTVGGRIYGVPWLTGANILLYNDAILKKVGFEPPKTWDDFVKCCLALKSARILEYPWIQQLPQVDVNETWEQFTHSMGGEMFDKDLNIRFTEAPAVKALQFMVDCLNRYKIISPEALTIDRNRAAEIFMSGKAAFLTFAGQKWYTIANDPAKSRVAGQVKATLPPGGITRCPLAHWTVAKGADVESARKYIKFMTSKDRWKQLTIKVKEVPSLKTLFDDPDIRAALPNAELLKKALSHGYASPPLPWAAQYQATAGKEIHAALLGRKSVRQAIDDLAKAVKSWGK